jgi:uncharacterized protein (TIGR02466 family)
MKKNYFLYPLFSQVVYQSILNDIDEKELLNIKNILEKEDYNFSGNKNDPNIKDKVSNSGASNDLKILNKIELKPLKDRILSEFNYFKNEILKYEKNKFVVTTSWSTKTNPGEESDWHNHHNCYYSGVFYINTDNNSGDIVFENFADKRFLLTPSSYNLYNATSYFIKPQNGTVIFFPSHLYHRIYKNNSNITRYSLAFNLLPVGELGEGDSQLILN